MPGSPIHSELTPTRAESAEALRLVLESRTFGRSEKLVRFLKYVSELSFRGEAERIHEHLIAIEVFDRGDDYSPGEDSVVRRQAHALRRKLKDYYDTEGKSDGIRIELPLGSYVPVFRYQEAQPQGEIPTPAAAASPVVLPATEEPAPAARRSVGLLLFISLALSGVIFAAGWAVASVVNRPRTEAASGTDPSIQEIWAPWLTGSDRVVLCFSNPPTTSVRQFAGPLEPNPEHQGIPVTSGQEMAFRRFFRFPDGGSIYLYPLLAQAKMGEALAAVSLTSFFTRSGVAVHAAQSRFVTWETLRHDHVIFLGHADSNQWIEPVLKSAPFTLAPTDQRNRARILNHTPRPAEQRAYTPTLPDANKSYALVSMLPGMDGSHEILVIGGLDTSSTTAATNYMMAPDTVRELLRRLKAAAPQHTGKWHFQAILETDIRDTVPLKAFPVALRVL